MTLKVFNENAKYVLKRLTPGAEAQVISIHDSAEEAQAAAKSPLAEYASERVYDAFVITRPGEAYRLLPFGQIKRASGGPTHNLTPESAAKFKLPHFKPPVKMGSHKDTTPAGGHIIGLEVRDDGLYAIPEWTDKGQTAATDGSYRYHSPEIIWDGGAIEDATTGQWINGPLIVGDALLHTPALGEATALYTSQYSNQGAEQMPEETVQVPKGLWEQLTALLKPAKEPQAPTQPEMSIPEEYTVAMKERDEYKVRFAQMEADKLHAEVVTKLTADLQDKKFGKEFDGKAAGEAAEVLAGMTTEQAEWVMSRLSAQAARIDYSKVGELGTDGANAISDPREAFAAAVQSKMKTGKMTYQDAYALAKDEAPDLFKAYAEYVPGKPKEG
jgi:hypothetical protein